MPWPAGTCVMMTTVWQAAGVTAVGGSGRRGAQGSATESRARRDARADAGQLVRTCNSGKKGGGSGAGSSGREKRV